MNITDIPLELLVHIIKFLKNRKTVLHLFLCIKNLYTCVKDCFIFDEIKYSCLEKVVKPCKIYYALGKIKYGEYIEWFKKKDYIPKDQPYIVCNYKDDKIEGVYREWYNNGQIRMVCSYKDGQLEGEYKSWYCDGTLRTHTNFKKNQREGQHYEFFDNGQLFISCSYKNNKLKGKYKEWCEDGQLDIKLYYKQGKLKDKFKSWYDDGQINIQSFHKNKTPKEKYKEKSRCKKTCTKYVYKQDVFIHI